MVSLIIRKFVKNSEKTSDPVVRRAYGTVSGIMGIVFNIILFAIKLFAGTVSGSIAITSDAFNNLSDAGSSVITLFGFKLSGAKPDDDHPYGHGRMEYIAGFVVSLLILYMGFELIKSSIDKIINPAPVSADIVSLVILAVAIIIKIYMYFYNKKIAEKINSSAVKATAADCISDAVSTAVVLAATIVMKFTDIAIDGWCGLLVALFIFKSGIGAAKDTIGLLLGNGPDPDLVENVKNIVMSHEEIIGIHDLMVHDYGPGRRVISLHGEVAANGDLIYLHDVIDGIERELREKLGCSAIIHMDPIDIDNEKTSETYKKVKELTKSVDERLSIHDLRIVSGPTHTNIVFDVVVPRGFNMKESELIKTLSKMVSDNFENTFAVIEVDQDYV